MRPRWSLPAQNPSCGDRVPSRPDYDWPFDCSVRLETITGALAKETSPASRDGFGVVSHEAQPPGRMKPRPYSAGALGPRCNERVVCLDLNGIANELGEIEVGDQAETNLTKARELAYERVCESYEAITEFRAKLLALLPLATGTGAFLLLERQQELLKPKNSQHQNLQPLGPVGLLGLVVTLGLFAYELRGMQRCSRLEVQACTLERTMQLTANEGPFRGQPSRSLHNMLGPPAACLVVYSATAFTWFYVAGTGLSWWTNVSDAWWLLPVYVVVLAVAWWRVRRWLYDAATLGQTKDDCGPPAPPTHPVLDHLARSRMFVWVKERRKSRASR